MPIENSIDLKLMEASGGIANALESIASRLLSTMEKYAVSVDALVERCRYSREAINVVLGGEVCSIPDKNVSYGKVLNRICRNLEISPLSLVRLPDDVSENLTRYQQHIRENGPRVFAFGCHAALQDGPVDEVGMTESLGMIQLALKLRVIGLLDKVYLDRAHQDD